MSRRLPRPRIAAAALLVAASCGTTEPAGDAQVAKAPVTRAKGDVVADFALDAVYTDDHGGALGERWVHRVHGMPVTVLHIQSVPQVFLAFHTPPVSNRGEPHTGEHLLLGKGSKGRALSLEQDMSLVESTAWTSQTDVCYSWGCAAGKETFHRSVEQYLDALLLPDFSDEEIRREVCHVGPVEDEATGRLSLDEKGTIYQEMVTTYEKRWNVWEEVGRRLRGEDHPLAMSSGGEPAAVRTCTPEHVRAFHAAHYHLGADTRMIVSLPDTVPEDEFLATLSAQMAEVDARPEMRGRAKDTHDVPPARPEPNTGPLVVPFPDANEDDGGMALVAWKPVPLGSQDARVRGELFLSTLGEGDSATLYKRLMDRGTRETPVDAAEMGAGLDASEIDLMPHVWFDGFPPRNATPEALAGIVRVIRDEIARVAALAPGSPELAEFDRKALVKLAEREKDLKRRIDSPPLFGHRGAGGFWIDHLRLLDQGGGFERSVTLAPVFSALRAELEQGGNPWTAVVASLGLADAPYVGVSVPSRDELERRAAAKAKRIEGYVADLARKEGCDAQTALERFAAAYDAKTAALEDAEKAMPKPHLVADVPLTPDPSIRLEPVQAGGVHGFRGVFDHMSFAETSVCFRVGASDDDLPWLSVLPRFVADAGVVEDGKPVPYDQAAERRAKEIYSLSVEWAMRPSKGRHELRVTASGADTAEAVRAIDWIDLCLRHAWLAPENLPRLRDLVSEEIQGTRVRLGGAEEAWVRDPAAAVRWQQDRLFLATSSSYTRLFLLARCEWRLMDAPAGADLEAVRRRLDEVVALGAGGGDLHAVADAIAARIDGWKAGGAPADAKWAVPVAQRIREMVADMAPSTVAKDLRMLGDTALADVAVPPADALAQVRGLLGATVRGGDDARFALTGSRAASEALVARLTPFFTAVSAASGRLVGDRIVTAENFASFAGSGSGGGNKLTGWVDARLRDHETVPDHPVHYGLVRTSGASGVFVLSANGAGLGDVDEDRLTSELATRVFGGAGPHAFFMKTWGAGLAYSNGLSTNPYEARVNYYAERCPDLVQTMTFVSGLVKDAGALDDPYLAEYAVAGAVAWSRESDEFESRTRAAADDMTDGDTPEVVATWRKANLDLLATGRLWDAMRPRIQPTVGRVIPGVGPRTADVPGALWFTIAPEPMLARWEAWLREHDLPADHVLRLYGRDFWLVR